MVIKKCGTCRLPLEQQAPPSAITHNEKQAVRTYDYADRGSCFPWVFRLMEPGQNWRFCCPGNPKIHYPVLSFFRTSVRPPAFAGSTKITLLLTSQYGLLVLFLFRKSILREPNIKIHIGSNQFKPPSALPFYDYWKKNHKFIVRLTGNCRNG